MNPQESAPTPAPLVRVSAGSALRHQRKLAGLSLRRTAAAAGISFAHLSLIERNLRKPSADVVVRVANAISESYR